MSVFARMKLRKAAIVVAALLLTGSVGAARAGETSLYLKTGWFTLAERVNGSNFVKEEGLMHGAGVTRRDDFAALSLAEVFEVWGGNPDFRGHDITGTVVINSDTSYLGTREEFGVSGRIPAGSFLIEPALSLGHKFWVRTRSSEDWNTFFAKAGLGGEFRQGGAKVFVKGGALVPFYTRSHASLADSGFTDVVTEPKTRVSGFAEGGVRVGSFAFSVEYEGLRFGKSDPVPTNRLVKTTSGIVVVGNQAFQPETNISLVSLKVAYTF